MTRHKSNMEKNTKQGEFGFTKGVENYSTRGQVYEAAVHHFQNMFPHLQAKQAIASALGMSYQMLCAVLNDERGISSAKQDELFRATMFPIGYDFLKSLTFPQQSKLTEVKNGR